MLSRREAVDHSLASARLEGLEPPAETVDLLEAWARDELSDQSLDDYTARILAQARAEAVQGHSAAA